MKTKPTIQELANAYLDYCDPSFLPVFGPPLASVWLKGHKQAVAKILADLSNRYFVKFWLTLFFIALGRNQETMEIGLLITDEKINQYMERFR